MQKSAGSGSPCKFALHVNPLKVRNIKDSIDYAKSVLIFVVMRPSAAITALKAHVHTKNAMHTPHKFNTNIFMLAVVSIVDRSPQDMEATVSLVQNFASIPILLHFLRHA